MSEPEKRYGFYDYAALLVLATMIAVPFLVRVFSGTTSLSMPLIHDLGYQWIPFREFIRESWRQGFFPLWSGNLFGGIPFASFPHTGGFYPFGWLFLLSDYSVVVNYFYPLHLFIAASGVYFLCRVIGLSPVGSWFAALSYVFCGKPFYFIHFLPSTSSNVWIPWFLFSVVCFLYRGKGFYLLLCAVFFSLQVLGGDVESTAYGLLMSVPATALFVRGHPGWLRRVPALALIFVPAAFLCLVQFLPLYEYTDHFIRNQGVTFSYFTKNSLPASLSWNLLVPIKGFAGKTYAGIAKPYLYLGFLSFVLAVFSIIVKARPSSRGLGILALLAFMWSFGSIPLLSRFQYQFPFLNAMDFPELSFFMGQLFLVILAGQAISFLERERLGRRRLLVYASAIFGLCFLLHFAGSFFADMFTFSKINALLCVVFLLALLAFSRFRPRRLAGALVAALCLFQAAELYGMAVYYLPENKHSRYEYADWLKDVGERIGSSSRYIMVSRKGRQDKELLYHAGLALGMDSVDGWVAVPPRNFAELMALADPRAARFKDGKLADMGINDYFRDGKFINRDGKPILDLVSLGYIIDRGLNLKFASPYQLAWSDPYYHRRECLSGPFDQLSKDESLEEMIPARSLAARPGEVYQYEVHVRKKDTLVFTPETYKLGEESGEEAGVFAVRIRFGDTVDEIYRSGVYSRPPDLRSRSRDREVRLSLQKYAGRTVLLELSNPAGEGCPGLLHVWKNARIVNRTLPIQGVKSPAPEVLIYANKSAMPRAFIVHRAEESSKDETLAKLSAASREELSRRVYLSRLPERLRSSLKPVGRPGREAAMLLSRKPGVAKYRAMAGGRGLLFMSEQYYPGWRAFVEGKEVPVLRADHCFRAVPIEGGVNLVELRFQPVSFRIGLFGSLAGLAACLAFVACLIVFQKKSGTPPDPKNRISPK
ncbi:MAG: YfhO family protein [bacterium]